MKSCLLLIGLFIARVASWTTTSGSIRTTDASAPASLDDFLTDDTVQAAVATAKNIRQRGKKFSDIIDQEGNQYVDLVQQGGGVLGIALVGYTYVLERAGIRFFSLAGTSAGAINTIMMAGLAPVGQSVSEKVLRLLSQKNLYDFVDGPGSSRKIIDKLALDKGPAWPFLAVAVVRSFLRVKDRYGLNPGDEFEQWIDKELRRAGIRTMADLNQMREKIPELKHRDKRISLEDMKPRLAIISSDITTNTKTQFPKMAKLYMEKPEEKSPATFVRASMSIPIFFEPHVMSNIPNKGKDHDLSWERLASYHGKVPETVHFMDGGLLSNFPINAFHRKHGDVPRSPTFGVLLSAFREEHNKIGSFPNLISAMTKTMRQIHDYDFLLKNPDYKRLICRINADDDFNWLDFDMSKNTQIELFALGATKAAEFLEGFDWQEYKALREEVARVKALKEIEDKNDAAIPS